MSKKVLSYALIIVFVFLLLQCAVTAQVNFPDLLQNHWAYSAVMDLVNDGTVKGFEDGEFKPSDTVSRAEFVKMIGKGSDRRQQEFADVNSSHWAYEYVMASGLEGKGGIFQPDEAITRNDVMNLIWKRNGSKTDVIAPSIITLQGQNEDAIAWSYNYGIMVGDDGINLRLDDTLTRAEAAALITRARAINESSPKKNFIDTVSSESLEVMFNSIKLFDNIEYDENKTITNGEMARAAIRLGSQQFNLSYKGYNVKSTFEHEYSKDLYAIGNACIGAEKINEEFIDKYANVQDTLTALTYNIIKKSYSAVRYGNTDNYYKDIEEFDNKMMNVCLTFAFENGIQLNSDGTLSADKSITLKEFACILLQLDNLIGSQSEITTDTTNNSQVIFNLKIRNNVSTYPANYSDYQLILEGLPNEVYNTSFADNVKNSLPKSSYDFAREYGFIFTNMLQELKSSCEKDKKVKLRFTYYSSLVCENGNGATLRIKCDVVENPDNISLYDIFETHIDTNSVQNAEAKSFYADIVTGQSLTDIYIPSELAALKQIVYIIK